MIAPSNPETTPAETGARSTQEGANPLQENADPDDTKCDAAVEAREEGAEPAARGAAAAPNTNPRHLATSITFALAVALGAVSQLGIVTSIDVASVNMVPTLEPDDRVMVRGVGNEPGLGDVIAYRTPFDHDHLQLGRIVAVEGDRVEMTAEGLTTNGRSVSIATDADRAHGGAQASPGEGPTPGEDRACEGNACLVSAEAIGDHRYFTRRSGALAALLFPSRIVPDDHVFVLGDNRVDERDSRIYGAIPRAAIVGVASFVYYASDRTGIRWDRMNRRVS